MAQYPLLGLKNFREKALARRRRIEKRRNRVAAALADLDASLAATEAEIGGLETAIAAIEPLNKKGRPARISRRGIPNAELRSAVIDILIANPGGLDRGALWDRLSRGNTPMPSEQSLAVWLSRFRAAGGIAFDQTTKTWKLAEPQQVDTP